MKRARSRPRVAILGCGAVGRALAVELLESYGPAPFRGKLRVWSRSQRSITRLHKVLLSQDHRRLRVFESAAAALAEADVLLLCLSDESIAPMARQLAGSTAVQGQVVLFTNGYLPLACLAPLRRLGCAIGRLHPLAPIRPGLERSKLIMAPYAIEGDGRAVRAARKLVRGLEGKALVLTNRPGSAAAYHAAASLLSGGLVALFHLAERVMSESVSSRAALRDALDDFAESTLENTYTLGPQEALTGALARGSESLVQGHLAALRKVPAALELYRMLGKTMLELAEARGSIDAGQSRGLRAILAKRRDRRSRRFGERSRRRQRGVEQSS